MRRSEPQIRRQELEMTIIKQLAKLPESAKDMFDMFLKEQSVEVSADEAMFNAWNETKENYTKPSGKKSLTIHPKNNTHTGNYIDVMLGKPTIDQDNEILDFWDIKPMHPIVGDMEHLYLEKAKGNYVPEADMFEGFIVRADDYYNKDDGSLWAKVEVPEHSYTPEFLRTWESGEYGVSIEYDYPEYAVKHERINGNTVKRITAGKITGFTFTGDPSIEETKINGSER